jgi:uncharacterized membrane protein YccC
VVALNEWLHWPPLMQAALAALLACLCDAGGPVRRRLPAILCFGLLGALLTAGFGLLRNAPLALVVPLASLGVFATGFARIYGQTPMQVGNLLCVALVLALDRKLPGLGQAAATGGMFLAGSLWALLLTMGIWRLHPYQPARQAVGHAYQALAGLARDLRNVLLSQSSEESVWDRHARTHRRMVREAIEQARAAVLDTVHVRGPISGRAAQSWIRLEAAEQMFGALIGLSDLLAAGVDPATAAAADRMLRRLRPLLVLLGRYAVTERPDRLPRLERAVAALAAGASGTSLRPIAEVLAERLRIALLLATPEGVLLGAPPPPPWRERVLGPLWANLRRGSEAFRHALRAAVVAAPAFAFTLTSNGPYQHWLIIVLVLTMQPYFALTFARALERIGGTILGGLIAAGLAVVCTSPLAIAVALFPLAMLALAVRSVSFGLFMACLTPLMVLLSELGSPGQSELAIAGMRALYTVLGGGFAVVGCLVLWPSWEPGRLVRELRTAMVAHGAYASAEIGGLLGQAPVAVVEQARRAAGLTSNNAEASLQRALMEPGRAGRDRLEAALTIDAALRRTAGRLAALHQGLGRRRHDPAYWWPWALWIEAGARQLALGDAALPPRPKLPPDDPDAEALARIARQWELVAGVLDRLRG